MLEEKILNEALQLGFAAAGIAVAGPCKTINVFRKWLAQEHAAGMNYLKHHASLRSDPREVVHGTKSIIVVAARYPVNDRPGEGFSTYTRGLDYHIVLRKKLKQLAEFIKTETRVSVARICVDSAPILEREWAIRAGISWRGKQGQIVNPDFGCCLLLGELLIDVELEPSPRVPNQCGDCRRCINACPTGALGEDGFVDARKCISYLTIEHKGEIPEDIRPLIGKALFGCDICTAVCPWNHFGDNRVMPELLGHDMPSAEECVSMSDEDFEIHFRDSPVFRIGLERLKRNATIVLGNKNPKSTFYNLPTAGR